MEIQLLQLAKTEQMPNRLQSFEDCCKELGINSSATISLSDNLAFLAPFIANVTKAAIITAALNEGWEPDFDNSDQAKWCLYFDMRTNLFSLSFVNGNYGGSSVPSRLCFKSKALGEYAAKQFPEIYKSLFINK